MVGSKGSFVWGVLEASDSAYVGRGATAMRSQTSTTGRADSAGCFEASQLEVRASWQ